MGGRIFTGFKLLVIFYRCPRLFNAGHFVVRIVVDILYMQKPSLVLAFIK